MEDLNFPTTAGALGQLFGARVIGDTEAPIRSLAPLQEATQGTLSFFADKKYGNFLDRIQGAVLFTCAEFARTELPLTYLVVEDPKSAFAEVARQYVLPAPWKGVSPQAVVAKSAELSEGANIAPFAVIGEHARIGAGTIIHPFAVIGAHVEIGQNCEIHNHVTLAARVRLGNAVKIFAGAVIGSDGFGLIGSSEGNGYREMPQIGTVVIEDNVRIGAKCTIDRATLGETRIGNGSKLDDQVHIGHNCRIGKNVILCAQVGLGGSVVVEDDVVMGGQVGVRHGLVIGKGARLGGQTGVTSNLKGNETYFLTPAVPMGEVVRILKYWRKIPEMWKRLRQLEKSLAPDQSIGEGK